MYFEDTDFSRRQFLALGAGAGAGLVGYRSPAYAKPKSSRQARNSICVAACQILTYPDLEKSVQKIVQWMKSASENGVDVVVFPEACLCGYQYDDSYWKKANPNTTTPLNSENLAYCSEIRSTKSEIRNNIECSKSEFSK